MLIEKMPHWKASLVVASVLVVAAFTGLATLSGPDTSASAQRSGSPVCPLQDAAILGVSQSHGFGICVQIEDQTPVDAVEPSVPEPEFYSHPARIYWDFNPLLPFEGNQGFRALNHTGGGDTCFDGGSWVTCEVEDPGEPVELIEVAEGASQVCRSNITVTQTNPDGSSSFGPVDGLAPCL